MIGAGRGQLSQFSLPNKVLVRVWITNDDGIDNSFDIENYLGIFFDIPK